MKLFINAFDGNDDGAISHLDVDVSMAEDDSQASMRRLCAEAERSIEDRQSEIVVPDGLPRDFMTDRYRIEMVGNHFKIVTFEESKEPSLVVA